MVILQAGIYPKNYHTGLNGTSKVPCIVCGFYHLHRLRVIRLVSGGQFILHICVRNNCLRTVVNSHIDPVKAKKLRVNSSIPLICSRCNRDARGGVAITDGFSIVNMCELCLLERVKEAIDARERVALQGVD